MTSRSNASVSLCMIVRNEERNLADCLTPVADLFDEIVIIDTGSTDQTRQVASRFTPHVFDFSWCDDFAAARNESLRCSSGDWVFWLDADDRIQPQHTAKLRALFDSLDDQPRVFMMDTVSPPHDACEPAWVVTHPRLFRRHADLSWRGRVHEQLRPEPASLGYEVVRSDIEIQHVGYLDSVLRHRKRQRKLRLLRMDYAVDPDDRSTLFHLGMAYAQVGGNGEARKHLLRLAALEPGPADYMRRVFSALAEVSLGEGKIQDALQMTDRGLALFPDDEQLLYVRAQILYEIEQYEAAARTLTKIITSTGSRQFYGGAPADIKRRLAPRTLGAVLRMQGALAQAETALLTVVQEFPADTHSWYNLGLVYLDTSDWPKLESVVRELRCCPQGSVFANLLLAVWYLRHEQLGPAGVLIEQLVSEAPQMPLPRMLRAEWLSRMGAPLDSQIQALRDLLRIQPGNGEALHWLSELETARSAPQEATVNDWCTSVVLMPGVPAVAPAR